MTREEAIERLEWYQCHAETKEDADAFDMAISALRPISREQVEKVWRGEWIPVEDNAFYNRCSKCGKIAIGKHSFCRNCGSPMTDEAVEMVMKRMEEMKNG